MRSLFPAFLAGFWLLPGFQRDVSADTSEARSTLPPQQALKLLRNHSPRAAALRRLEQLVRQLGDDQFDKREQASRELIRFGMIAWPALQRAASSTDLEQSRRAKACLAQIQRRVTPGDTLRAIRVLLKHQPPATVTILLGYLPHAVTAREEAELAFGLDALVLKAKKVPDALVEALDDSHPKVRSLAGCLVGRHGNAKQKARVRRLLDDRVPCVRLRAAQGLLAAKDDRAVPVLIALLDQADVGLGYQAEELLRWVAGKSAPSVTLGAGSPLQRRRCQQAWQKWKRELRLDLTQAMRSPRRPFLVLASGSPSRGKQTWVWLTGSDGVIRWQLDSKKNVRDVFLLSNGVVLTGSSKENTPQFRSLNGTILPLPPGWFSPAACWPTLGGYGKLAKLFQPEQRSAAHLPWGPPPGSGSLLTLRSRDCVQRTTTDHRTSWSCCVPGVCHAELLPDRSVLAGGDGRLVEIDCSGQLVWDAFFGTDLRTFHVCFPLLRLGFDRSEKRQRLFVPAAQDGLQLQSQSVRCRAVAYLAKHGAKIPWATQALRVLVNDPDEVISREAQLAQAAIRRHPLTRLLHQVKTSNSKAKVDAIWRLNDFRDYGGVVAPVLLAALHDPHAKVRAQAANILGGVSTNRQRTVDELVRVLRDPDSEVGAMAAYSLGRHQQAARKAVPALLACLKHKDLRLVSWSAGALVKIRPRDPNLVPAFVALLKQQKTQAIGASALGCLRSTAAPAVPALLKSLEAPVRPGTPSRRSAIRSSIVHALGRIGPKARAAVLPLVRIAGNLQEEEGVRADALRALASLGTEAKEAVPGLKAICRKSKQHRLVELAKRSLQIIQGMNEDH